MAMERVLLQTIKFDFNVEHAHKFIIQVGHDTLIDTIELFSAIKPKQADLKNPQMPHT